MTMARRLIGIATIVTLMLLGTASAGKHRRVESDDYLGGGIAGVVGVNSQALIDVGSAHFQGGPERFVNVTVEDETGRPVLGEVGQNLDSDEEPEISYFFCGNTDKAVKIKPRYDVTVYLYSGRCEDGTPSLPVGGTVAATFTKKK
jgi:hypothetical protein